MATYTLSTTDDQEEDLAFVVAQTNAEREKPLSAQDYLTEVVERALQGYRRIRETALRDRLEAAYRAAPDDVKAQIHKILEVS